jgi:hypothetical protein
MLIQEQVKKLFINDSVTNLTISRIRAKIERKATKRFGEQ